MREKSNCSPKHKTVKAHPLTKLPRLLWRMVCVGLKIETEFRTNFLLDVIHFIVSNALLIVFWQAIAGETRALGSWTAGELLVFNFVLGLQSRLSIPFIGLFRFLPERVRNGELDKYLCRPVNPIFALGFESMHVIAFLREILINLAALAGCILYFRLRVTVWQSALATILLALSTLIWVFVNGTVALLSFWTGKVQTIGFFINLGQRFRNYPIDLFPNTVKLLLTWFVPVALMATYPTMIFLGKPVNLARTFSVAVLLGVCWGLVFGFTAQRALARYEAFGG
ncbi:MAG: ABC-2 family transporter protein [Anaerolineae bacterium]|nr:ABC-2 family transporter protein [Anaerolineae bacterium]